MSPQIDIVLSVNHSDLYFPALSDPNPFFYLSFISFISFQLILR